MNQLSSDQVTGPDSSAAHGVETFTTAFAVVSILAIASAFGTYFTTLFQGRR